MIISMVRLSVFLGGLAPVMAINGSLIMACLHPLPCNSLPQITGTKSDIVGATQCTPCQKGTYSASGASQVFTN